MATKYSEALFVRVEPSLKAALENLLSLSTHNTYPTMGDLLRDILETGVKSRLKKAMPKEEDCGCSETYQSHQCGKK